MEVLSDIANKIGFDWKLALTHLINFLIIFFLLVKYALPKIVTTIKERTKKIEEGLMMRKDADKIVANANFEAKEIGRVANKKAEDLVSKGEKSAKDVLSEANLKASELIRTAESQKEEAKNKGIKEAENILSKDISSLLSKISTVAFSKNLNSDNNSEFVSKVFKETYSK